MAAGRETLIGLRYPDVSTSSPDAPPNLRTPAPLGLISKSILASVPDAVIPKNPSTPGRASFPYLSALSVPHSSLLLNAPSPKLFTFKSWLLLLSRNWKTYAPVGVALVSFKRSTHPHTEESPTILAR